MIWRSALTVLTVAVIGAGFSLASGRGSMRIDIPQSFESKPSQRGTSGCQTTVDGQLVRLNFGEDIRVGKEWQTCQIYDGHPVVIHSSELKKSTALEATN